MAKNRNFEVVAWEDWGNKLIAHIRVLDKEYRYELPNTAKVQKTLKKKWFVAADLEFVESQATSYGRSA